MKVDISKLSLVEQIAFYGGKQVILAKAFDFDEMDSFDQMTKPLILAMVSNYKAMVRLGQNGFGNEVFIIARAFFERVVTFFYLYSCDEVERERYVKYSNQKTYRKMEKYNKIFEIAYGSVDNKYNQSINLNEHPELKSFVEEFTSKKGREQTRWSQTSLEDKLAVIKAKGFFKIDTLRIALLDFYDDGSEALHGTLYGCLFHIGAFQPHGGKLSRKHVVENYQYRLCSLFFLAGGLLYQIVQYLAEKYKYDNVLTLSEKGHEELVDLVENEFKQKKNRK